MPVISTESDAGIAVSEGEVASAEGIVVSGSITVKFVGRLSRGAALLPALSNA